MRFFKKTADRPVPLDYVAQPPDNHDQVDQPVLPDEKELEEMKQQNRDYLIQRGDICTAVDPPDIRDQADRHVPLDCVAQPPDNLDQADQPVLPDEKVLEEAKQKGRDPLIQSVMKMAQEVDDRIYEMNQLILKSVYEGERLSPDANDVRQRLVDVKRVIPHMLKDLTEPDTNLEETEAKLLARNRSFLTYIQEVCQESERFLGKQA
ncbi:hypothetical protein Neosp_003249 [[Neocosmospora] mangrovei]